MSTYLSITDLYVNYGNIKALKGITLSVNKGEIVSLIGANGAGKSTLLKAISGIKPITKGEITFKSETLFSLLESSQKIITKPDSIVRKGISLVPEGRGIFTDLTVMENLEIGAFTVSDKKIIRDKIRTAYDYFPILKDRHQQKAGSLSGGEQQMLAISRALMSSPELLLLDEPALGLAPLIIRQIFTIIKEINSSQNVTILLVEQNAKMALEVSDKGHVLETGSLILSDKSSNLINNDRVKKAYLGET